MDVVICFVLFVLKPAILVWHFAGRMIGEYNPEIIVVDEGTEIEGEYVPMSKTEYCLSLLISFFLCFAGGLMFGIRLANQNPQLKN